MKKKLEWAVVALFLPAGFVPIFFLPVCASGQASSPSAAIALEQQGKLAEAAQVWRAVIQKDPNDAGAFASLGVILSKQQKYHEAASVYAKAIALNPTLPGVQLNLGLAEFKQGNFQAAIAPLHAASAADPQNPQASTLLGFSCYGARRFAEAASIWRRPQSPIPAMLNCTRYWRRAVSGRRSTLAPWTSFIRFCNTIPIPPRRTC